MRQFVKQRGVSSTATPGVTAPADASSSTPLPPKPSPVAASMRPGSAAGSRSGGKKAGFNINQLVMKFESDRNKARAETADNDQPKQSSGVGVKFNVKPGMRGSPGSESPLRGPAARQQALSLGLDRKRLRGGSDAIKKLKEMVGNSAKIYTNIRELCVLKFRDSMTPYITLKELSYCALRTQLLMSLHDAKSDVRGRDKCYELAWTLDAVIQNRSMTEQHYQKLYGLFEPYITAVRRETVVQRQAPVDSKVKKQGLGRHGGTGAGCLNEQAQTCQFGSTPAVLRLLELSRLGLASGMMPCLTCGPAANVSSMDCIPPIITLFTVRISSSTSALHSIAALANAVGCCSSARVLAAPRASKAARRDYTAEEVEDMELDDDDDDGDDASQSSGGVSGADTATDKLLAEWGMVLMDPPALHLLAAEVVDTLHKCVEDSKMPAQQSRLRFLLQLMQLAVSARDMLRKGQYHLPEVRSLVWCGSTLGQTCVAP